MPSTQIGTAEKWLDSHCCGSNLDMFPWNPHFLWLTSTLGHIWPLLRQPSATSGLQVWWTAVRPSIHPVWQCLVASIDQSTDQMMGWSGWWPSPYDKLYGKSPFSMGKSTINGHITYGKSPCLMGKSPETHCSWGYDGDILGIPSSKRLRN